MLNAAQFYEHFGVVLANDEVLEFCHRQVFVQNNKLFVVSIDHRQDPFSWMSTGLDGIVFTTQSGYLAVMVLFDGPYDQTNEAIEATMMLVEATH